MIIDLANETEILFQKLKDFEKYGIETSEEIGESQAEVIVSIKRGQKIDINTIDSLTYILQNRNGQCE